MAIGRNSETTTDRATEALTWYVRLTSGHATDDDWAAHAEWLAESPENLHAFSTVQMQFEDLDAVRDGVLKHYEPSLTHDGRNILSSLWNMVTTRPALGASALAAAAIILVVGINMFQTELPKTVHFETAVGEVRQVILADGSSVDMDTNTAIDVSIGSSVRTAVLDRGRAIFDVHHEANRPFLVNIDDHQVRVLGTKFEVAALKAGMSVAVIRGRVGVSAQRPSASTLPQAVLEPGDKLTFADGSTIPSHEQINLDNFGAWTEHRLTFDATPLHEVVDDINRYFPNTVLRADGSALQDMTFTGSLYLDSSETVAENLASFMSLQFHREGGIFVLEAPAGSDSED